MEISALEYCYGVTMKWQQTAFRHAVHRSMFKNEERPAWCKTFPTETAAIAMRHVIHELLGSLTLEALERATIQITNDVNAGCYLQITSHDDDATRVNAHILHDGTIECRFYRWGVFRFGSTLWPDGHQSSFLEEPLEVL